MAETPRTFTVQTFNGHDSARPLKPATFVALQERGGVWSHPSMHMWYPPGLQEALGWTPLRYEPDMTGRHFLHGSGRSYGQPNTTPERWALYTAGTLDSQHKVALIGPHLINNAWGPAIRGERRLRRKLWRQGWRRVQQLRHALERQGYAVFIAGDLNRKVRWWDGLRNVVGRDFDRIIYPPDVELIETWTGDANGSDHHPVFGRFRFKAPR